MKREPVIIQLGTDELVLCEDFADARLESSAELYKSRGEKRIAKIRQDIVVGALAEFAVFKYISSDARPCTSPDLQIYEKQQKSYAADLVAEDMHIHVKSQTTDAAERWGRSWLFQRHDPLLNKPTIDDFIALTEVDGLKVKIHALVPAETLIRMELINVPKLFNYAKTKRAVYHDEILASGIDLFEV